MLLVSALITITFTIIIICLIYLIRDEDDVPPSGVRRHNGSNAVWKTTPDLDSDDTVVIGRIVPVHAKHAQFSESNEHDTTIEPHNSTGRHSIENHARTIVPCNWMPPLGNTRIALIETPTSEYLIARKPKPQNTHHNFLVVNALPERAHTRLRDEFVGPPSGFVRKYVTNLDMVNA